MRLHRNCISDRIAQEMWRDYQAAVKEGNPLGLSYTEYVAARVIAQNSITVTSASATEIYYKAAQCGHQHPWGESCSVWTNV